MTTNLLELLPRNDAIALVGPRGNTLTYNRVWNEVESAAACLKSSGIQPGDRVVLLVPMSIDLYIILLAVFHRGATATLVDPSADIQRLLTLHPPDAFIGIPKAHLLRLKVAALRGLKAYFSTGFTLLPHRRFRNTVDQFPPIERAEAPALLTFTSGTTDTPKAIARSHAFLIGQHRVLHKHMSFGPGDIDMPTLPVFLLHSLASGATCVLADADLRAVGHVKAEPVLNQIRSVGVSSISGSPAFFKQLATALTSTGTTIETVRHIFTGGARVPGELVDQLTHVFPNAAVDIVYGSTECEPIAVLDAIAHREALVSSTAQGAMVGQPVEDVSIRLDGEPFGEILVAGPHVNPQYVDNPEADARHKLHEGGKIWHRTGDVGRLDDQGTLWLVGRVGESVGGVWPLVAEGVAESFAFVERAGLVEIDGQPLLAIELGTIADDWESLLTNAIGVPVTAVDRIPVDTRHNAKVDRRALKSILNARH